MNGKRCLINLGLAVLVLTFVGLGSRDIVGSAVAKGNGGSGWAYAMSRQTSHTQGL